MVHFHKYQNTQIRYKDFGEGFPVVLIHGYLESLETWGDFAKKLASQFRVILIDLPGHGGSGCLGPVHTMELMADAVSYVLKELKVSKCTLIGHSLGGYVTMAFVEKYPELLNGFCLFHSSPFADNEEKKNNRDREIEIIKEGKKELIFNAHCPKVFANDNQAKFHDQIEIAKAIAKSTPDEGIIAVLEGMKSRPDRSVILKNTNQPFLYVIGKKDNFIPFEILSKIGMPVNAETLILENSGHNGFIEESEVSLSKISSFIKLCNI
jgi:pimeloyl-ACP methyl ester carboxylesterase